MATDAVVANDCELVESLLASEEWRVFPHERQRQSRLNDLLRTASMSPCDNAAMIQLLVAHGANVNGLNVLHAFASSATTEDHLDHLDAEGVFTVGADVLSSAAYSGNLVSASWLLQHGADVNSVRNPPLHVAAREGNLTMLKRLLAEGFVDIDGRNLAKHTPLMTGVHRVISEMEESEVDRPLVVTKWLLAAGANVALKDENGWTALHHALNRQFQDVVETLLKHGASVHDQTRSGDSALDRLRLDLIAEDDIQQELQLLLANGADPLAVGTKGESAKERLLETDAGREFVAAHPEFFVERLS